MAQMEDAEIEAVLSMIEGPQKFRPLAQSARQETPYGSDDEEYDDILLEVIDEVERKTEDEEYQSLFQDIIIDEESNTCVELPNTERESKNDQDMMDTM